MPEKRRPGRPPTLDRPRRVHLELDAQTWQRVEWWSKKSDASVAEVIRTAIGLYFADPFFHRADAYNVDEIV